MDQPGNNLNRDTNADDAARNSPSEESSAHHEVQYERTDVSFRAVLIGAVVGCVVAAGIFLVVRAFFWTALDSVAACQGAPSSDLERPSGVLPPEPRLEQLDRQAGTPASSGATSELAKEKRLESYGFTDEKGFVRIPLQRAMDLAAGHLPVRQPDGQPKAGSTAKDRGLVDGGESNSGRMFRQAGQKPEGNGR
jgi:hypothetical protein